MFAGNIYNISYELAGTIINAVILYVLYAFYGKKNKTNKYYRYFVISLTVCEIIDVASTFTISYASSLPHWLNYVVNNLYFLFSAVCLALFLQYMLASVNRKSKFIMIFSMVVLSIYCLLILTTPWTGLVYTFENDAYEHGLLYYSTYGVLLILIGEYIYVLARNWKNFRKGQKIANVIFPLAEIVSIIIQATIAPYTLLTYFGGTVATLIVLFSLETPDYDRLVDLQKHLKERIVAKSKEAVDRKKQVEELTGQTLVALALSVDNIDTYTNGHSVRVAQYSRMIASRMGFDINRLKNITYAGLLHDVGKIGIDSSILKKKTKLTDEEYEIVKKHPVIGYEILKGITSMPEIAYGAHWHHEHYDGTGYPDGLKGSQIPEIARIIAVADCYDTMTSKRCYRDIMPQDKVREEFVKGKGTHFDPQIAQIMISIIDEDKNYSLRESRKFTVEEAQTILASIGTEQKEDVA